MRASIVVSFLALALCGAPLVGQRPWRLGVFFWHESPNDRAAFAGIREALDLHGRPHEFLEALADSDPVAAKRILEDFRRKQVDLVFAMGTQAALLAKEHVKDIPVVFTAVTHPVESGVVPSWQGSGCNLAGNSNWIDPETTIRVFRLAVPSLRRIGVLRSKESGLVSAAEVDELRRVLAGEHWRAAGIEVVEEVVERVEALEGAVGGLAKAKVDAIWIPIDFTVYQNADRVLAAARAAGIPIVSSSMQAASTAAIAGILPNYELLGQRAAVIALQVLAEGKAPASLPVGTMRAHRVVVNLGVARRCGYELPLSALVLADRILEEGAETGDGR